MLEAWKRNSYTAAHLKEVTKTKPCEFGPDGMPVLTREELFDSWFFLIVHFFILLHISTATALKNVGPREEMPAQAVQMAGIWL